MSDATGLLIKRDDLRDTRWSDDTRVAAAQLADGAVRVRIDGFALTANNITYAAFGDSMRYWHFYPTDNAAWGRLPVWGFADIVESRCVGLVNGERLYGFWPLATHAVVIPRSVSTSGFSDSAAHRRELHAVYNRYQRCAADPGYSLRNEPVQALLQPLFTTAFLIDDLLADNDFYGAGRVLMSSASSKTALATAHCMGLRANRRVRMVGLTSPGHLEFVRALACYDEVLPYGNVSSLPHERSVYVDFSGDATLRAAVHSHCGDQLAYSCAVGGTHWQGLGSGAGLPGPRPQLFFAPAQISKRNRDWGADVLQQRLALAWTDFVARATAGESPWLVVERRSGRETTRATYLEMLDGRANPHRGLFLTLRDSFAPGAAP